MSARLATIVTVLLAASLAHAQDASVITLRRALVNGRTVDTVQMGDVVTLEGSGLHECPPETVRRGCTHDGWSVTVGNRDALIAACTSQSLTVILPFERFSGDQQVRVTRLHPGPMATATLRLHMTPWRPASRAGPWPLPFVIDRVGLLRDRDGEHVEVTGRLGDLVVDDERPAFLTMTLACGDRTIAEQALSGSPDGTYEMTFGPFERELMAGSYTIALRRDSMSDHRLKRRGFETSARPALCSTTLEVGTAGDVADQRSRAREHFRALATTLFVLRRELERAREHRGCLVCACRGPARCGRRPMAPEAWITTRLLPELNRVRGAAVAFDEATILPIVPTARERVERLADVLLEASRPGAVDQGRVAFDVERRGLLRVLAVER